MTVDRLIGSLERSLARGVDALLGGYRRYVSPLLGRHCRFHPTCSRYAALAVRTHGCWRGGWLAVCRLCRCHPLHPGGLDPVPPPRRPDSSASASNAH